MSWGGPVFLLLMIASTLVEYDIEIRCVKDKKKDSEAFCIPIVCGDCPSPTWSEVLLDLKDMEDASNANDNQIHWSYGLPLSGYSVIDNELSNPIHEGNSWSDLLSDLEKFDDGEAELPCNTTPFVGRIYAGYTDGSTFLPGEDFEYSQDAKYLDCEDVQLDIGIIFFNSSTINGHSLINETMKSKSAVKIVNTQNRLYGKNVPENSYSYHASVQLESNQKQTSQVFRGTMSNHSELACCQSVIHSNEITELALSLPMANDCVIKADQLHDQVPMRDDFYSKLSETFHEDMSQYDSGNEYDLVQVQSPLHTIEQIHQQPITAPSDTGKSMLAVEIFISIIYDHVVEPTQQWWKDNWPKYLRRYIRDVKQLIKMLNVFIRFSSERFVNIIVKCCTSVFNSSHSFATVDFDVFPRILSTLRNIPLLITSYAEAMYDYSMYIFSEICTVVTNIRLTIRHFMHNDNYRFNYFWYCFYTIINSLGIIWSYQMTKKAIFIVRRVSLVISGKVKKIYQGSRKVSVSVGTTPYKPSLVSVDANVLRSLVQNKETEVERLEEIEKLEEQLEHARLMTEWSDSKNEALQSQLERLLGHVEVQGANDLDAGENYLGAGADNLGTRRDDVVTADEATYCKP